MPRHNLKYKFRTKPKQCTVMTFIKLAKMGVESLPDRSRWLFPRTDGHRIDQPWEQSQRNTYYSYPSLIKLNRALSPPGGRANTCGWTLCLFELSLNRAKTAWKMVPPMPPGGETIGALAIATLGREHPLQTLTCPYLDILKTFTFANLPPRHFFVN